MFDLKWMLLLAFACAAPCHAQIDVAPFIKQDQFNEVKISPTGEYLAATVPMDDRTGLVVLRLPGNKVSAAFTLGRNRHVQDFWWVNPQRVIISLAEKQGGLDEPRATGELFAIDADGGRTELLVGYRVEGDSTRSRIQNKKAEDVAAFLVDTLPRDDKNVIVTIWPFMEDPYTRADKLDVYSGRRSTVARAPVRRASFVTDQAGVVRFAAGAGSDNANRLYHRTGDGAEWELLNDETSSGHVEAALGFSADNGVAYLQVEQRDGPDSIVALDMGSRQRTVLLQDKVVDPYRIIYRNGTSIPVGAFFMGDKLRAAFFDENSADARFYRSLEAAFPGDSVNVTSATANGNAALLRASSDRNPGDYFLFDTTTKQAHFLLARRSWFDPEDMAEVRSFDFKARDGLVIHGYLTLPPGSDGKALPMVVLPHGGPFGIFDVWGFDVEAQMLAKAGYAVLQPNFRGSGNYGRAYRAAGARQWGGSMQDDVTDATRWAIGQGIADAARICIYGASYGAYAALMGVAKEPALYRCAAGYVGVYDLPMMYATGDIQQRRSGEQYLKDWLGAPAELAGVSPVNLASRIKVPVFLAAGGADERAPIAHSKKMEAALRKAGGQVETLYYETEGHGFYAEPHRREFNERLLAFLQRNLGVGRSH